jgi:hypothetical protein
VLGGVRVRRIAVAAGVLVLAMSAVAYAAPTAQLQSEDELSAATGQGVARIKGGWILTGTRYIARVDEKFKVKKENRLPIPPELTAKGYNHVGDIDVVGKFIYAPLEQDDYELGEQITARYSVKTLKFIDSVTLAQHENSFVTVDPKTMIAYSFDHFGGQQLFRYDVKKHWAPLDPIDMSLFVDKVQGADVLGGVAYLSTCGPPASPGVGVGAEPLDGCALNSTNEMYRVDLETGEVVDLGSAGHVPGEGEGIDATKLKSGIFHTMVIDPKIAPVYLGHYTVSE